MRGPEFARSHQCPACGAYLEADRRWSLGAGILGVVVGAWLYGNFSWLKLAIAVSLFLGLGIIFGFGYRRFRVQGRPRMDQ
jgi:uncharacterized protein (DUF983 family)